MATTGFSLAIASSMQIGLASMCEVSTSTSNERQHLGHVVPRAEKANGVGDAEALGPAFRASPRCGPSPTIRNSRRRQFLMHQRGDVEKHLVVLLRPQRRHDARHRRRLGSKPNSCCSAAIGPAGMEPLDVDAVGNDADLSRPGNLRAPPDSRPCGSATAMKASVSGASRRLGNSTWSGRPVECSAEQITGTPASQPASRPQNILSPPVPTVTTASIRRRRNSRVSRQSTAKSYLWASRPVKAGISCASTSPSGSNCFRQHNSGEKPLRDPCGGPIPPAASPRRRRACS